MFNALIWVFGVVNDIRKWGGGTRVGLIWSQNSSKLKCVLYICKAVNKISTSQKSFIRSYLLAFRPTKMLVSATKWLQLIVGSSFTVILAIFFSLPSNLWVGAACGLSKFGVGVVATWQYLFLLLVQKYWCYVVETCVYYESFSFIINKQKQSKSHIPRVSGKMWKISIFSAKICKIHFFCDSNVIKTTLWNA